MDYIKTYKSFINSHYFSEGLRITSGVLLPVFALGYFNMLSTGIVISLGALFVSITDSPGPIHHRQNGMAVCIAAILIITLLIGFLSGSSILLALLLIAASFFFSMIGIYGARAAAIGTAALIVMTISLDTRLNLTSANLVIQHSLLMSSGGLWYMCYSMLLYNFRPYRLAQQALGDYIEATAEYLKIRSELYKNDVNYEKTFNQLLQQQAIVQHKQTELTELLFKTRSIVKDTTTIGRTLVLIHLEIADIFEKIMMSHQQYSKLHSFFDETGILKHFYQLTQQLSLNLEEIGIAVKSGEPAVAGKELLQQVLTTREKLDQLRLTNLQPDNIEGFISLRRILENIQDIADRLQTLHGYTTFKLKSKQRPVNPSDIEQFISHQPITPAIFFDHLTLKSDTFRHSIRVSTAIFAGFLTTLFFDFGHSYWILLTIVVILKPAFSLTKKRNTDRLAGTFAGVLIGILILYLIQNTTVLLVLLILLMIAAYTFMRINYFVMVLLMTPYLILFYHLLHPQQFALLLKDRIIDTILGSAIAISAGVFVFPAWEREKIKPLMIDMVTEVQNYFAMVIGFASKEHLGTTQQVARKNVLVALANLSEAFNRMLSEPKNQQKGIEHLYQFVVLNHMLTSYVATLYYYIQRHMATFQSEEFSKVASDIKHHLHETINNLNNDVVTEATVIRKDSLRRLNNRADGLLLQRTQELQQGEMETATRKALFDLKSLVNQMNLIYNATVDINKISQKLKMN